MSGLNALFEELGGPEQAIGQVLIKGHEDAMGENPRVRIDWAKILLQAGEMYDTRNASAMDLSEVDEEDLKACVTELAVKLLSTDGDFRQACLMEAVKHNPDLLDDIAAIESEQVLLP